MYKSQQDFSSKNSSSTHTTLTHHEKKPSLGPAAPPVVKMNAVFKMKNDLQKKLVKGYVLSKQEEEKAFSDMTTRTPEKSNAEVSPYVIDFYKKRMDEKAKPQIVKR